MLTEKEARNYAAAFAASGMFKNAGNNLTPDQVLVCIMAGQEFGWGPAAALMNLHVIEGRPELSADAQARFIKASGKYEYRVTEHTNEACEITVLSVPNGEIIGVERFTMDDAKLMGLGGPSRNGKPSQWMKSPRNMLFARCVSNVTAFHCPDALPMRTYTVGEIQDGHEDERLEAPKVTVEQVKQAEKIEEEVVHADDVEVEEAKREDGAGEPVYLPENWRDEELLALSERFMRDVGTLNEGEKNLIRMVLEERELPFKTSVIVGLMREKGFTDVRMWLAFMAKPEPPKPEPSPFLPSGMTSQRTGSQTSTHTINDAQVRKFHAKCGEAGLSEDERKRMLFRYTGVTSSRQIAAKDFDELLLVLKDIAEIPVEDTERRSAYL